MKNGIFLTLFIFLGVLATSFAQSLPDYLPKDGLAGWYPFNSNASDLSGNGNNGMVNGATITEDRFGNANSAYSFDGINDYIQLEYLFPSLAGRQSATYNCWSLKTPNTSGTLVSQWYQGATAGPVGLMYGINANDRLDVGMIAGEGILTSQPASNTSAWNMYTVVFNGNAPINADKVKIYQNGVLLPRQLFNAPFGIGNQSNIATFGARAVNDGIGSYFNGKIDDIGIWNRALTEGEIIGLYQSGQCNVTILKDTEKICKGDSLGLKVIYTDTSYFKDIRNMGWQYVTSYSGKSYWLYKEKRTWDDAVSLCTANGGQLFCPNTKEENDAVAVPITTSIPFGDFWIGLYQDLNDPEYIEPDGGWKWIDGSPLLYTNWQNGEPNGVWENHGILDWSNWEDKWNDTYGVYQGSIIMEFNPLQNKKILWSTGDTTQSIKFKVDGPAVVSVTISDQNTQCSNSSSLDIQNCCLPDYVPTDGLVGYWPFCGNANDESGNGNDGVVHGATLTKDRFGNENKAYSFDGVDDYIVAINSPSLNIQGNQLSISSWVYCTIGTQGQIVSKSEVSSRKYGQYINGLFTELGFELNNSDSYNGSIQHNKWSNLITTYDGNQKKWYIDGDLVFSTSYSSNIISNNLDFYIGTFGGLIESFFNNTLDDIGIWNRALTEAEIKTLYEGSSEADSPLTLSLDTITGRRGDVVVLPVRVKNFTNILSGQMSLTFDPAIVTLAGVENFGTDSITQASFNLADAASGKLSLLWTQNDNIPISLSNGDTLFAMRFKVLGRNTQFTDVRFATSPLGVEFVDASLNAVDNIVLQNGRINAFSENILSGQLRTETGQGIRSATLAASGDSNAATSSALSGQYTLTLPELTDLKVTPSKANDTVVTNGITIADIIRMQRHILGSVPLESPYKIIAADVNHSGTITGLDVVLVNALILGRLSTYPGGKLWSFVPTSHTFTNPQQPFPYPNYRSYSGFSGAANADFIGMKLGDVDNSYTPSQGRNPSADTVTIYTEDQQVPTGATEVRVPVRVSDFESISGFQFGVQWDPAVLKYKGAEKAAALSAADLGIDHTGSGHLNVAWFHPTGLWTTLSDGTAIMELIFETVGAPGSTSTVGVFDSPTTPVEIIQDDLSSASAVINTGIIALGTPSSAEDADAEGLQVSVYPNPFSDALNIEIQNAAISGSGMLSVYDEAGRQMYREEVRIEKGTSRLITGAGLPAGSYTLRLEDRDGRIIKQQKAIKIR